ncbi:amidase [Nocardia vinacea]|uniref:Amidase n=1 Tax=Nocardia vinacea TaxID=96468 RepID=A0ABZ1YXI1_9NOCA|nr:amidase [Nocardia vinacea]
MKPVTIADAAAALRSGETTSVELTRSLLSTADACDETLGIYLARFDETALSAAEVADAELSAGIDRGPLHGIPLAIKDIIATADGPTTAQSLVLDPEWGRQGDAPVVSRLRSAGAVITGKTTTMEFAIGAPDPAKPFPIPRNPWNLEHWAGGSSSGMGNGIAAGALLGGLGTDTGGSIRFPAANCGITGLKPTFGRVPKTGCVPLGYSYDHIGPMARSAEDCALLLQAIAGHEPGDPSSADMPVDGYISGLTPSLAGLRIGFDPTFGRTTPCDPALAGLIDAALAELGAAGASVVEVRLPLFEEMETVARLGLQAEGFAHHRHGLRTRWEEYAQGTRLSLVPGALISGADYVQAQRVRRIGCDALNALFADIDLAVTPTSVRGAPRLDDMNWGTIADPLRTSYWDAAGNPAISVPMGFTASGLPLGLQIAGRPFAESTVLAAGYAFQHRTRWHLMTPSVHDDRLPEVKR